MMNIYVYNWRVVQGSNIRGKLATIRERWNQAEKVAYPSQAYASTLSPEQHHL